MNTCRSTYSNVEFVCWILLFDAEPRDYEQPFAPFVMLQPRSQALSLSSASLDDKGGRGERAWQRGFWLCCTDQWCLANGEFLSVMCVWFSFSFKMAGPLSWPRPHHNASGIWKRRFQMVFVHTALKFILLLQRFRKAPFSRRINVED